MSARIDCLDHILGLLLEQRIWSLPTTELAKLTDLYINKNLWAMFAHKFNKKLVKKQISYQKSRVFCKREDNLW